MSRWTFACELTLVAALGAACAVVASALLGAASPVTALTPATSGASLVATPANETGREALFETALFSPAAVEDAPMIADTTAPSTTLNIKLFGVRMASGERAGSAILAGPDNAHATYVVGETILPGVTLDTVLQDRVIIAREGRRESLLFESGNRPSLIAAPSDDAIAAAQRTALLEGVDAAPVVETAAADVDAVVEAETVAAPVEPDPATVVRDADAVFAALDLRPVRDGDVVVGYALHPKVNARDAFADFGLQPGDQLVGLNGRRVGPGFDVLAAFEAVERAGRLDATLVRDGTETSVSFAFEDG